jgi:hypothetical protein
MAGLIEDIRKDETYLRFKKVYATTSKHLDVEKATQEALALHTGRTSRMLVGADRYSAKKLIDASYNDLRARSRLVEIRVTNDKHASYLEEAMSMTKKYIRTEYADDLREFGTVADRQAFVDRMFKTPAQTLEEVKQLISMLDTLIKDIDQANFQLKSVVACLQLLTEKKGSVL